MTAIEVRRVVVVTAGTSAPSSSRLLADQLATSTVAALEDRGAPVEVQVFEMRDLARDLTNHLLTGFPSDHLAGVLDAVVKADALIAVTPIFRASYSGLFKTFFDVLDEDALAGKPVLIAATAGTVRHSLALEHALRPLFTYLRAVVVPTGVFAATDDFGASTPAGPGGAGDTPAGGAGLAERITRATGQLADLLAPATAGTARGTVVRDPDPFLEPTPFERLLAG